MYLTVRNTSIENFREAVTAFGLSPRLVDIAEHNFPLHTSHSITALTQSYLSNMQTFETYTRKHTGTNDPSYKFRFRSQNEVPLRLIEALTRSMFFGSSIAMIPPCARATCWAEADQIATLVACDKRTLERPSVDCQEKKATLKAIYDSAVSCKSTSLLEHVCHKYGCSVISTKTMTLRDKAPEDATISQLLMETLNFGHAFESMECPTQHDIELFAEACIEGIKNTDKKQASIKMIQLLLLQTITIPVSKEIIATESHGSFENLYETDTIKLNRNYEKAMKNLLYKKYTDLDDRPSEFDDERFAEQMKKQLYDACLRHNLKLKQLAKDQTLQSHNSQTSELMRLYQGFDSQSIMRVVQHPWINNKHPLHTTARYKNAILTRIGQDCVKFNFKHQDSGMLSKKTNALANVKVSIGFFLMFLLKISLLDSVALDRVLCMNSENSLEKILKDQLQKVMSTQSSACLPEFIDYIQELCFQASNERAVSLKRLCLGFSLSQFLYETNLEFLAVARKVKKKQELLQKHENDETTQIPIKRCRKFRPCNSSNLRSFLHRHLRKTYNESFLSNNCAVSNKSYVPLRNLVRSLKEYVLNDQIKGTQGTGQCSESQVAEKVVSDWAQENVSLLQLLREEIPTSELFAQRLDKIHKSYCDYQLQASIPDLFEMTLEQVSELCSRTNLSSADITFKLEKIENAFQKTFNCKHEFTSKYKQRVIAFFVGNQYTVTVQSYEENVLDRHKSNYIDITMPKDTWPYIAKMHEKGMEIIIDIGGYHISTVIGAIVYQMTHLTHPGQAKDIGQASLHEAAITAKVSLALFKAPHLLSADQREYTMVFRILQLSSFFMYGLADTALTSNQAFNFPLLVLFLHTYLLEDDFFINQIKLYISEAINNLQRKKQCELNQMLGTGTHRGYKKKSNENSHRGPGTRGSIYTMQVISQQVYDYSYSSMMLYQYIVMAYTQWVASSAQVPHFNPSNQTTQFFAKIISENSSVFPNNQTEQSTNHSVACPSVHSVACHSVACDTMDTMACDTRDTGDTRDTRDTQITYKSVCKILHEFLKQLEHCGLFFLQPQLVETLVAQIVRSYTRAENSKLSAKQLKEMQILHLLIVHRSHMASSAKSCKRADRQGQIKLGKAKREEFSKRKIGSMHLINARTSDTQHSNLITLTSYGTNTTSFNGNFCYVMTKDVQDASSAVKRRKIGRLKWCPM